MKKNNEKNLEGRTCGERVIIGSYERCYLCEAEASFNGLIPDGMYLLRKKEKLQ